MKFKTLKIGEAHKIGIAGLIRSAESDGLIMLQRSETPVAILVPLTFNGFMRFMENFVETAKEDLSNPNLPLEKREFLYAFKNLSNLFISQIGIPKNEEVEKIKVKEPETLPIFINEGLVKKPRMGIAKKHKKKSDEAETSSVGVQLG